MTFNLKQYLAERQKLVNLHLTHILHTYDRKRELIMAMEHSLMAGGKRLRPILCMAAAQVCEKDFLPALPASCAIEMIHTYSLIHDDLPAMDDDDLRRGVQTCHKKFCESTAILAGDALLTHAFYLMAQPETYFDNYPDSRTRLHLIGKIASSAGVNGMVEGQILDMQADLPEKQNNLHHLKKIHELKTGKMISASVECGAISVGADESTIQKLMIYAGKIGLAFQVVDDILNVEGNPEIMGKSAGSDVLNEKMTFPAIIGLEASKKYAEELVETALEALLNFDQTAAAPLESIAKYIINRDH